MLYISVDDFFKKANNTTRLSREDEKAYALKMRDGDAEARNKIIGCYLPLAASYIKRLPKELQTLEAVYAFIDSLEKGVDSFNFFQSGETFIHHLSFRFRQCTTRLIANRY